ncbi:hypothetical protein C8R45DRAFT_365988 [Mycena sanguinolenta]|nr:hypothetical protein C8R45DRAFT_365988 [Mycena sanguinolenta]
MDHHGYCVTSPPSHPESRCARIHAAVAFAYPRLVSSSRVCPASSVAAVRDTVKLKASINYVFASFFAIVLPPYLHDGRRRRRIFRSCAVVIGCLHCSLPVHIRDEPTASPGTRWMGPDSKTQNSRYRPPLYTLLATYPFLPPSSRPSPRSPHHLVPAVRAVSLTPRLALGRDERES